MIIASEQETETALAICFQTGAKTALEHVINQLDEVLDSELLEELNARQVAKLMREWCETFNLEIAFNSPGTRI